ncbi:tetratricopeptide repeat protein [Aggregatilinea lenta]|uniref:tetratricopeptide repeat protein n=1 Tax=Aggregatilinea lenta TaxID=913108 RepID=UPI000E5BDB11|nr:tetratricopeptide repeat protein [Aggregatilinea lenta]
MALPPDLPHDTPSDVANLPVQPPDPLFGRDAELNAVRFALESKAAVLLHGPSGIGKTALAARLAEEYGEHHEVLWFTLNGDPLHAMLNQIARAYDSEVVSPEDDLGAQIERVRGLLQDDEPLVVLDGQVDAGAARQLIEQCAAGVPVLLTHPQPLNGPWSQREIARLDRDAANAMLIHLAGPDLEADLMDLMALGERLGGHPLAISIAGHHLAVGAAAPAALLAQMSGLPAARLNPSAEVVAAAYRLLPPALRGMLLLVGTTFTGGASEELLADVSGAPDSALRAGLRQIVARGLAIERTAYNQPYFATHEIVQAFVRALLAGKHQLDALSRRHVAGLLSYVRRHTRADTPDDYDRLTAEIDTIMAAGRYMTRARLDDALQTLIELLDPDEPESFITTCNYQPEFDWLLYMMVYPDSAGDVGTEVEFAAPATPHTPAPEPQAATPEDIPADSPAPISLPKDMSQPDEWSALEAGNPLSEPEDADDEWDYTAETEEDAQQAVLEMDEDSGDAELLAPPESEINPDEDEDALQPLDIMSLAEPLADAELLDSDVPDVEVADEPEAVAVHHAPTEEPTMPSIAPAVDADRLFEQAKTARDQGDLAEAGTYYGQALEAYTAAEDTQGQLAALQALAEVGLTRREYEYALSYLEQGLRLTENINAPQAEGHLLALLGDLEAALGKHEGAEDAYREALNLLHPFEDWLAIGQILDKLGVQYLAQERYRDAVATLEQTTTIFERVHRPDLLGPALDRLGEAHAALLHWDPAKTAYTRALRLARDGSDPDWTYDLLVDLGAVTETSGDQPGAIRIYQQALRVALDLGDPAEIGHILLTLARMLMDDTMQINRAVQLLEGAVERLPENTDARRLLSRAKARQERLTGAGVTLAAPEPSLDAFALPLTDTQPNTLP